METPVVPSVNSSLLQQIPNSTARLAGKIKTVVNQNKILLIASDKGTVEVNLAPDSGLNDPQEGQFVEVTGKVTETGDGIKEYSSLRLSDNLDLDLVEQSILLSQSFPQIFTDAAASNGMADY